MKRVASILLAAALLFIMSAGTLAEAFSFRNGISWNSSAADVKAAEGDDYYISEYNGFDQIIYENASVSEYGANLLYTMKDDALVNITYGFEDFLPDDQQYIVNAMTEKYGAPMEIDHDRTVALIQILEPECFEYEVLANWALEDGTYIAAINIGVDYLFYVVYFNEPMLLSSGVKTYNTEGL